MFAIFPDTPAQFHSFRTLVHYTASSRFLPDTPVNIPAGATLRYTTDGTVPTLTNGSTSTTGLFTVSTTTCYRFRLFQDGYLPSVVTTRSYILRDRDYYLPVVSVVTDPKNLYDNTIGAYVSGSNGKTANQDGTARNFNMEWDRPVNFEYIVNNDQEVINQMVDYAISGGWSRKYTPRPFKLKSAKQYGINELGYAFFADKPYNKYKNILMRNGGNDEYNQTRLKDVALQEIARQSEFKLNLQSFQPAHVFYNGEYIAMLNMREVSNKQYAYSNYGYDTDEVDAFEVCVDSGYVQKSGTREAFERLYDLTANASDEGTYEEIRKLLDIDDFINYMAFKFFLNDWDWPHNNFKAFRSRNDGRFHFGTIDGGTGSYLYVIPYHHVSEMLYLLPASVGLGSVPESVGTYHAVGVEDDIVAYLHSGIDDYAGIDDAVMAYHGAGAYGHILVYDAIVPDLASLADDCAGAYRDLAAYLGAAGYTAAPGTVAAVKLALVGDVLE